MVTLQRLQFRRCEELDPSGLLSLVKIESFSTCSVLGLCSACEELQIFLTRKENCPNFAAIQFNTVFALAITVCIDVLVTNVISW